MLSEKDVRDAITAAVDRVSVDDLGIDENFHRFGLDSLDHAQILIRLEEIHGLRVADADFEKCLSIAAIIDYSRTHLQA